MYAHVLTLALLTGAAVPAESAVLRGQVQDTSGGGIAAALVVLACPGEARTATADRRGRFEIRDVPPLRCSVSASHDYFASTLIYVDLSSGADIDARLVMPVQTLEEAVLVTPSRGSRESVLDVPAGTSIVSARDLEIRPGQILPHALREEPGISVQQTTAAAGSPIIRGFTGQSVVYLLDGVRFNTSSWRAGPVQYLGWLSPATTERLEVVRGPLSVQYGSDALGGAVNVIEARPGFSAAGIRLSGALEGELGSGDESGGIGGRISVHAPRAAVALTASRERVGDLRTGDGVDSHAAVTRFLGLPSPASGARLARTGYEQWGVHLSGQARSGLDGVLSGFYRRDVQRGVNRYDRIEGGQGLFRSEITPQRLEFGVLRYERASAGVLEGVRATFSFNRQSDGTIEQARPTSRIDSERNRTTALGYQVQGSRRFAENTVTAGVEVFDEYIDASRWQETAGNIVALRPLIPDGTRYTSAAAFGQVSSRELAGRFTLRGGVRYSAHSYRTAGHAELGIHPERIGIGAVTFNAAGSAAIAGSLRATVSAARGFRAANASDLGAIGVSGGAGFEIAPSTAADFGAFIGSTDGADAVATSRRAGGLAPESVHAFEAGLRYARGGVSASATLFDLELFDAIQRRALIFPESVVGRVISGQEIVRQDAAGRAYIAIDPRPISTRVNSSRARVRGLDLDGSVRHGSWSARVYFSMSNGRDLETGAYLRRMPPPLGGVTAGWQRSARALRLEGTMTFAREQTRLSSGDLSDARIGGRRTASSIEAYFNGMATDLGIVKGGVLTATGETLAQVQARVLGGASAAPLFSTVPGWVAFGARALYPIGDRLDLIAIAENLTDRNYRSMGSGVDAPGANVALRVRMKF